MVIFQYEIHLGCRGDGFDEGKEHCDQLSKLNIIVTLLQTSQNLLNIFMNITKQNKFLKKKSFG